MLEQHRLATAAPTDHDHDLAAGHVQAEPAQDRLTTEGLVEVLDPNHGKTDPRK